MIFCQLKLGQNGWICQDMSIFYRAVTSPSVLPYLFEERTACEQIVWGRLHINIKSCRISKI